MYIIDIYRGTVLKRNVALVALAVVVILYKIIFRIVVSRNNDNNLM